MAITPNEIFQDAEKARDWLEALLWPEGPVCPHCGCIDNATKFQGKAHRDGVWKCKPCEKQFTVTVGTVFERSHIPLNKWLMALFLLTSSKKGMSTHQMHRMLAISYKSAWFMTMRLRKALESGTLPDPLGGIGKPVEIDETYVGGKARNRKNHIPPKEAVVSLVQRKGGVRSHHVASVNGETLGPILKAGIRKDTFIMTDDSTVYPPITGDFRGHGTVNHSAEEYVRGVFYHTNTVENYFSILKRGIIGTFHHVSPEHLHRYLVEFDFRYNNRVGLGVNDNERFAKAAKGIVGKRLTYRRIDGRAEAQEAPPF